MQDLLRSYVDIALVSVYCFCLRVTKAVATTTRSYKGQLLKVADRGRSGLIKNICTDMPKVPLKYLGKRSLRLGATCWGMTSHEASWAGGWVMAYAKSVKVSPTPLPNLA